MNSKSKIIILKDYVIMNNRLVPKNTAATLELSSAEKEKELIKKAKVEKPAVSSLFEEEIGEGEQLQSEINMNIENQEHVWEDSATLALLDEYENHLQDFRNPKVKKKVLWDKIAKSLRENKYANVDGAYLDQKFRNMKTTFKKIKDNNKKSSTGRGRVNWKYYNRFDQIFASDKTMNTPTLISSTISLGSEPGPSDTEGSNPAVTPTSSRSNTPDVNYKTCTRLDTFRKRQLEIEEGRLAELKAIRMEIAESNRINLEKLILLRQYFDTCHNNK